MTEPKRLALVGPMHPYRGGIAHFLEKMYRDFAAKGHTVEAVTFTRQYPERLFPGKTQLVEYPHADTAPVTAPDTAPDTVPAVRMLDTIGPRSWFRTARHLAARKPDAVIFKYWMPFFAPAYGTLARLLNRHGIPSFVVVDNAIPHERRPGDLMLSRYFLKACAGLVVMSDAVAADLGTLGVDAPVRQVAHPVYDIFGAPVPKPAARAALGLPDAAPVLLFFGFVRKYKGLHVLLDAMPRLRARLPDVHLVVAGEFYDDEAPYRALIEKHGLADCVHLHADYIPDEAVARYFSAADLVVQPYVSATQSGVAQIAFHFEKPLVVTDVGGLAEIVPDGEAGFVVPPEDPAALAEAVVRFFVEDRAATFAEGVRREKRKYSWDRLYEALEAMM